MAVTVKRKKLQIKAPSVSAEEESGNPAVQRLTPDVVEIERANWTPFAIAGILAVLVMIALLLFQYLEYDYYKDAFPIRTPQAGAPAATTPEEPVAEAEPVAEPEAESEEEPASTTEEAEPLPEE